MITFAYLTYEDVQRIPNLKEQTVIVIKAPAGTKLEVPHPDEVGVCNDHVPLTNHESNSSESRPFVALSH